MDFNIDVSNIPLKEYVIIKKIYTPMNKNLHDREGLFLAKVIQYDKINVIQNFNEDVTESDSTFIKEHSILCSIFGVEEESMFGRLIFLTDVPYKSIIDTPEKIPVIRNIKLSFITSYHILTPDEYPLLVHYYWLDDPFKEEAFGTH